MDGGQHNSRSSVYLIIISFSLTAVLIIIYHWMTKFYRRQQERGQVPQFFGPARGTELMLSIDASTVQMLAPALTYKKAEEVGGEDGYGGGFGGEKTCPVCLSDFEDGDAVRVMPECGHCFHVDCIDRWLQSHSTCPVCRSQNFSV